MESIIGKEWRDLSRGMFCIIVGKFSKREEIEPVALLVVTKNAKILFKYLVDSFRLAVRLWVKGS